MLVWSAKPRKTRYWNWKNPRQPTILSSLSPLSVLSLGVSVSSPLPIACHKRPFQIAATRRHSSFNRMYIETNAIARFLHIRGTRFLATFAPTARENVAVWHSRLCICQTSQQWWGKMSDRATREAGKTWKSRGPRTRTLGQLWQGLAPAWRVTNGELVMTNVQDKKKICVCMCERERDKKEGLKIHIWRQISLSNH